MENSQKYGAFSMHLLMKEKVDQPSINDVVKIVKDHLGELEVVTKEGLISLAILNYTVEFETGRTPVQVLFSECENWDSNSLDIRMKNQMWNCSSEEKEKIFRECKYQIIANDTFAMTLHPHNRATLLMSYLNALMEIFPQCEAVLFLPSYKMMMADKIRNCETPIKDRFIDFCINIRFFSVENTNNMIVDTLGMNTLLLPDIQYYFHEMNHQWAVAHAYSLCKHLFNNGSVLKNGATTPGFSNKGFDTELYWKCIEESSLLVPKRPVINIDTGNYAISNRPSK